MDWQDTIVGCATDLQSGSAGCRSILRITGPRSLAILNSTLPSRLSSSLPWHRPFVHSVSISLWSRSLPCVLYSWPDHRSYTGQPTIEQHLPACPPIVSAIQADWIANGARLARPGEFTLRAFLAGRLDLPQAEAVLGLIQAETIDQLRLAIDQRTGGLSRPIHAVQDELLTLLAELEAGLDFADEDVRMISDADIVRRLEQVHRQLANVQQSLGQRADETPALRIVLVGPPNAGKSTLFNFLVGADRALVSNDAGTTRDYLIAKIAIAGRRVELIDTAGMDESADAISVQASDRRGDAVRTADLIIACRAVDMERDPVGHDENRLSVLTKCDLNADFRSQAADAYVSALWPESMHELSATIARRLASRAESGAFRSHASDRCGACLAGALAAIVEAIRSLENELGPEYAAVAIREGMAQLGEIVGSSSGNDLLDRIFSKFCIGK